MHMCITYMFLKVQITITSLYRRSKFHRPTKILGILSQTHQLWSSHYNNSTVGPLGNQAIGLRRQSLSHVIDAFNKYQGKEDSFTCSRTLFLHCLLITNACKDRKPSRVWSHMHNQIYSECMYGSTRMASSANQLAHHPVQVGRSVGPSALPSV
jgi:hypothetical protein